MAFTANMAPTVTIAASSSARAVLRALFRGAPPFPYMLSFCFHSTMINNTALIIKAAKVKVWLIFFGLFPFLLKREEGSYTFPSLFFMVFSTALSIFS